MNMTDKMFMPCYYTLTVSMIVAGVSLMLCTFREYEYATSMTGGRILAAGCILGGVCLIVLALYDKYVDSKRQVM